MATLGPLLNSYLVPSKCTMLLRFNRMQPKALLSLTSISLHLLIGPSITIHGFRCEYGSSHVFSLVPTLIVTVLSVPLFILCLRLCCTPLTSYALLLRIGLTTCSTPMLPLLSSLIFPHCIRRDNHTFVLIRMLQVPGQLHIQLVGPQYKMERDFQASRRHIRPAQLFCA